jgi:RNA polymerase sigma factor (sigma-70 family)
LPSVSIQLPSQREVHLESLVSGFYPTARRILGRFRIPATDAEDLLQTTFVLFLEKRNEIANPEAWLAGTLRMRCRMYWRVRRRNVYRAVDEELIDRLVDPSHLGEERMQTREVVRGALADISPRCQTLLDLRYRLECDGQETAARMGYRHSGIYKLLERCLAALTARLVAVGFGQNRGEPAR